MAEKAHVTSIETLDQLRVALMIFIEKASIALDEVSEEVKRTRIWLQTEQPLKLDQMRKRNLKDMELLEQELYSARLSSLKSPSTGLKQQINHKRRQIRDLEDTLRAVKGWSRNFDSRVEPQAKKVDKLRSVLDHEMGAAVQFLTQSVKALEAYAEVGKPAGREVKVEVESVEDDAGAE